MLRKEDFADRLYSYGKYYEEKKKQKEKEIYSKKHRP